MVDKQFQDDPFCHTPQYITTDGQTGIDCLSLAGSAPKFSLSKLALYFSRSVLFGEFMPDCPWQGVGRVRRTGYISVPKTQLHQLIPAFIKSIRECIASFNTIAISFSGGLDSSAVLTHTVTLCHKNHRRLIIIIADLKSDNGTSSSDIALQFLENLNLENLKLDYEIHIVPNHLCYSGAIPQWNPAGPRLDAMPELNATISNFAQEMGADVILTGSGADELLSSGRYLLSYFLFRSKYNRAWSYMKYVARGGLGSLALEGLGLLSKYMPKNISAQLYWATNWPELADLEPPSILAEPYRSFVLTWTEDWLRNSMMSHVVLNDTWAVADAWDSLFPHDVHMPAGNLPELSPFLNPSFARFAMGLPLEDRFSENFSSIYHRYKSLVVHLFPENIRCFLPTSKQIFSKTFSKYHCISNLSFKKSIDYGLFDVDGIKIALSDPIVIHIARSVENWIIGAERMGATAIE